MLGFLTSRLAGPIASAVAVLLAIGLIASVIWGKATEHGLNVQIAALQQSIDDPKTGWRVQVGQCAANVTNLTGALDQQTAQVEAWKKTAADQAARADANAAAAAVARSTAQKSASAILNLKPGADHCASALDLIRSPS